MHKYKPRVHIIQHDPRVDLSQFRSLPTEGVHSFSFPETEFTTVTAYQNQQVKTFTGLFVPQITRFKNYFYESHQIYLKCLLIYSVSKLIF